MLRSSRPFPPLFANLDIKRAKSSYIFPVLLLAFLLTGCDSSPGDPEETEDEHTRQYRLVYSVATQVYTIKSDGSDKRQLTHGGKQAYDTCWSADGGHIIYRLERLETLGGMAVHIMDSTGQNDDQLSSRRAGKLTCSRDRTRFAFGHDGSLVVLNIDGQEHTITGPGTWYAGGPGSWSPDGQFFAFPASSETYGEGLHKVSFEQMELGFLSWGHNPAWSPDGSRIAFVASCDPDCDIFTIQPDGSGRTRLTDSGWNHYPLWSPDGSQILYVCDQNGDVDLCLMNADGSNSIIIVNGYFRRYHSASWSPDGNYIAYLVNENGSDTKRRMFILNMDTEGVIDLGISQSTPDWHGL